MNPKLIVLDTETTGLEEPGIVEVAWLELDDDLGVVLESEQVHLLNPEKEIEPGAAGVHGIRNEDITDDLPIASELAWPDGEVVIICHNVAFDRPLVEDYMDVVGELCTMKLARRLLPDAQNHQLPTLSAYCDLERQLAHRAMGDVLTTAWLLEYMAEGSGLSVWELIAYSAQPIIFTHFPFGKWKGTPMEDVPKPYLRWFDDKDVDRDTRGTIDYYLRR